MVHGSMDQSISPYKNNSKKFHQNPILVFSNFSSTGLLQPPVPVPAPAPLLYQSFPPYPLHQSSQPPLLPLPAAAPRRSASCSPPSKKVGGGSRKPRSPQKGDKRSPRKSRDAAPGFIGGGGGARRCESLSLRSVVEQLDIFSGSAVFTVSPPPSSLPLPTFSMRPKLSCMAEVAAGVDAGATDDLRRLLRLR